MSSPGKPSFLALGRVRPHTIIVALGVVCVDQLAKHWAVSHLNDAHADHVIWTLRLKLSFNSGMAFGHGQGFGPFIGVLATIIVVVLLLRLGQTEERHSLIPSGLIVGGALGNIIDRLFRGEAWLRGEVVDFIDVQWFPIFNVADACINVGGVLLVLTYLLQRPERSHV